MKTKRFIEAKFIDFEDIRQLAKEVIENAAETKI